MLEFRLVERIIEEYEVKLVEAGCAPGSSRYGVLLSFGSDISPVMPYLNAVMEHPRYDHGNRTLILREAEQVYAMRPNEIRIARANNWQEALDLAAETVERVNRVWNERMTIEPRTAERKIPSVIEVYKQLPQTNCKECGFQTCLAFAAELVHGSAFPEDCLHLAEAGLEKILALFAD